MSKTNIVLLVVILIILVAGGVGFYFVMRPRTSTTSQAARNTTDLAPLKETVTADKTYEDEAGFSFGYPNQFTVKDITPSDNTYYTKLRLSGKSGEITLTAVDTTYKTLAEWQSLNKDATLVGANLLGDVKANQYKKGSTLLTVAIDKGVLYTIENISDAGLLDDSHAIIASSFKFSDQASAPSTTTSQDAGVEYEAEEVIE